MSVTDERVSITAPAFDPDRAWRVHPQVALRDESFGALAYHYGTRRLVFLKSRPLVELVSSLQDFESANAAIDALIPEGERSQYRRALARLATSEVISDA
ncbi:MAG TPA: mycofactocin biosynthesis chaperone MftB [Acidimicrobiales bacterium]|nr:mycofactocin biosynthesis chaperone MftB [Acidimicrobiales bacterium]